jgi:SAM-dependent methyltransferase
MEAACLPQIYYHSIMAKSNTRGYLRHLQSISLLDIMMINKENKMTWNNTYKADKTVWGDQPSELGTFAWDYLKGNHDKYHNCRLLDLGCGYGRDALYLAGKLGCQVMGIDNSEKAIEMAIDLSGKAQKDIPGIKAEFRCCDFRNTIDGEFEIVFASNFYQLLRKEERAELREVAKLKLKTGGILFLSVMSTNDPEHAGKGKKIENEENSYFDEKFLHFSNRGELGNDFNFLSITRLLEKEFFEPRSNGVTHHHISWLLAGVKR